MIMDPLKQLTYEMDNSIEDLAKLSNMNKASMLRLQAENLPQSQSYYSSYKDYLSNKFGSQVSLTENNDKSHLLRNERSFSRGRGNDMSMNDSMRIRRYNVNQPDCYANKLNAEVTPYSSLSKFSQMNCTGTNPFEHNNQRESRNGFNSSIRHSHPDNEGELMTASKTNYGRNRPKGTPQSEKESKSLANSACFKSIHSLDSIKHLPLEEQVSLLFNENQALKEKVELLSHNYSQLQEQNNILKTQKEGEQIDNKNKLNDFLMKNNKELQLRNKETETMLEDLLSFANDLNKSKGKPNAVLTLDQLKQSPEHLKQMLDTIREEVFNENVEDDKERGKDRHQLRTNQRKKHKKGQGANETNESNSNTNSSNSYYPYNSKIDCLPCSLGISNSKKGYSPRMCSPNRDLFIKEGQ